MLRPCRESVGFARYIGLYVMGEEGIQGQPAQEVPLSGELAEFREALRAEIDAARRSSAHNVVPLSNGRRLTARAGGYQYQFSVESVLDLPGDTPGELHVDGQTLRVGFVGTEGLTITLAVEVDLGAFVPRALFQSNVAMLLLRLIDRIEEKSARPNPAGDRILHKAMPAGEPEKLTNAFLGLDADTLNNEQLSAVGSALGRDTTYVWGPPGTGKTKIIGSIAGELLRRGKSVLVVSHTNVAIDGAMLKIAELPGSAEAIREGKVIRVGTPRWNNEEHNDLKLHWHAERKRDDLAERQAQLKGEQEPLLAREATLREQIQLHEWLVEAEGDLGRFRRSLAHIEELRDSVECLELEAQGIQEQAAESEVLREIAEAALWATQHRKDCRERWEQLHAQLIETRTQLEKAEAECHSAEAGFQVAAKAAPWREQLSKRRPLGQARQLVQALERRLSEAASEVQRAERDLESAKKTLADTQSLNWIMRNWRGLPSPEAQERVVGEFEKELQMTRDAHAKAGELLARAIDEVRYTERLIASLEPYKHVGTPKELQERVLRCSRERDRLRSREKKVEKTFAGADAEWNAINDAIDDFRRTGKSNPQSVLDEIVGLELRYQELESALTRIRNKELQESELLERDLSPRIALLKNLGYLATVPTKRDLRSKLEAVEVGIAAASETVKHISLSQAKQEHADVLSRLNEIAGEVASIEEAMKRVEETIIREALVVGATLTGAYLRDAIQNRRFDTVILDEASISGIPALWVAASVCDRAVVIIGDFKQLPPVVLADQRQGGRGAELAKRWLGRDPFEVGNISKAELKCPFRADLREQYRMHPRISAIANELFYSRGLQDAPRVKEADYGNNKWWPYEDAVLLVDTGPLNAWTTSVVRGTGGKTSRFNVMSATICADIAADLTRRMKAQGENEQNDEHKAKILIVSPYKPHATLIDLMLREARLDSDAKAGTVHSFQGSEADVVIFDLVNDEPSRLVGLFSHLHDEGHKRMFNVAITRARKRLVVVGDFDFCEKHGKNAFIGKTLIPYLRRNYPIRDAREVVAAGVASRAAAAKRFAVGAEELVNHQLEIVLQDAFYPKLYGDLQGKHERIVIYSPFITRARLSEIETPIKEVIEKGAHVVVVTKSLSDRKPAEARRYRDMEDALRSWNVRIIHKRAMHEKLIFIDSNIVWKGSLNPLSFSKEDPTQEIMVRHQSSDVFKKVAEAMQLDELLRQFQDQPRCPVEGSEMDVAEGLNSPLYLKCSNPGCSFKSGMNDDLIRDGVVRCMRCGGEVTLKTKQPDGRPRWVCRENPTHQRLVKRMHLELPKMTAHIAERTLAKLKRMLDARRKGRSRGRDGDDSQGRLFGDDDE